MVRVVLVMHQPLGSAFVHCAGHVLGCEPDIVLMDITPADSPEDKVNQLQAILADASATLVLTDIFGATPFNIARKAVEATQAQGARAELVTGTNLCMIIKALTGPRDNLQELVELVRASGAKGIVSACCTP
ncbi:PTS sugar transporter subunit IIA [Neopusillimonas maritima]|uniref:PTS sugar transporter subunit IIA n=1 Tax=Neopusillimonas maritima TaxID=2026239 RepID=A0A3A1YST5_9BURK|nr:PTS sugar transporter subunit IIA [Neopusillimonas maritima]RII81754.1 PTS sugar transporter subunit IIA [Neopusillimonas maritima]RIY39097.1 PTS sugar transporter subunit IIA [Neopusillimonas maritima]|tara:strand:- start:80 stop:475 length:396 start_codon:yes stop_codon:yes gene_type:complete